MATISGNTVKTFAEANLAYCEDIHMNADYPHFDFVIEKVEGKKVTFSNRGITWTKPIKLDNWGEYVSFPQSSAYEQIYNKRPRYFKVRPFKGKRS